MESPLLRSPLPDYLFPGIGDERLAAGLAGFLGTLVLFALGYGVGRALRLAPRAWSIASSTSWPGGPARSTGTEARLKAVGALGLIVAAVLLPPERTWPFAAYLALLAGLLLVLARLPLVPVLRAWPGWPVRPDRGGPAAVLAARGRDGDRLAAPGRLGAAGLSGRAAGRPRRCC